MARPYMSLEQVLDAIAEFEARYGVPSEDRRSIAGDGEPCANDDLRRWDALVLVRVRAAAHAS